MKLRKSRLGKYLVRISLWNTAVGTSDIGLISGADDVEFLCTVQGVLIRGGICNVKIGKANWD